MGTVKTLKKTKSYQQTQKNNKSANLFAVFWALLEYDFLMIFVWFLTSRILHVAQVPPSTPLWFFFNLQTHICSKSNFRNQKPKTGSNRAQNTANKLGGILFFLVFSIYNFGVCGCFVFPKWLINDSGHIPYTSKNVTKCRSSRPLLITEIF